MVDTARSAAYLLSLLATGQPEPFGQTTFLAQGARDLIVSLPQFPSYAPNFNFPAESPAVISGGVADPNRRLTAGVSATVRFSTVPAGVNGSDANHYLYINDGASSEAVLITGGTASPTNRSDATITFTPANNHAGAWTITSASGGITEANISGGAGVPVYLGAGTYTIQAPIVLLAGSGLIGTLGGTFLVQNFTTGNLITVSSLGAAFVEVTNLYIQATVTVASGYYFVYAQDANVDWSGLHTINGYGALWLNGSQGRITKCFLSGFSGYGIRLGSTGHAAGPVISDIVMTTSVAAAVSLWCDVGLVNLSNFDFQNGNASPSGGHILISGGFSESTFEGGILDGGLYRISVVLNANTTFSLKFSNILCTGGAASDAFGVILPANVTACDFTDVRFSSVGSATKQPILIEGANALRFSTCTAGSFVTANCIAVGFLTSASKDISFDGCTFGFTATGVPETNLDYAFEFSSLSHTYIKVVGTSCLSAVAPMHQLPAALTGWKVANNPGIGNVAKSIAAAATLTFPVMDDQDTLVVTGNTNIGAVAGLREGQTGILICTGTPAWTNGATVGSPTVTLTANVPGKFAFTGGKIYVSV
jgi:hypothetical protein